MRLERRTYHALSDHDSAKINSLEAALVKAEAELEYWKDGCRYLLGEGSTASNENTDKNSGVVHSQSSTLADCVEPMEDIDRVSPSVVCYGCIDQTRNNMPSKACFGVTSVDDYSKCSHNGGEEEEEEEEEDVTPLTPVVRSESEAEELALATAEQIQTMGEMLASAIESKEKWKARALHFKKREEEQLRALEAVIMKCRLLEVQAEECTNNNGTNVRENR
jgi:hypothetical protein